MYIIYFSYLNLCEKIKTLKLESEIDKHKAFLTERNTVCAQQLIDLENAIKKIKSNKIFSKEKKEQSLYHLKNGNNSISSKIVTFSTSIISFGKTIASKFMKDKTKKNSSGEIPMVKQKRSILKR